MASLLVLSLVLFHVHATQLQDQVTSGTVRTRVLSPSEAVTTTIQFGPYNCPPLVFPSLVTDAGTRNDGMEVVVHDITPQSASVSITRRVPTVPTEDDLDEAFILSNGLPALVRTERTQTGGLRWMFHRALDIGLTRWAAPLELTALRGTTGALFSSGALIGGHPAFHVLPFSNSSRGVLMFLRALDPLGASWPNTLEHVARLNPSWSPSVLARPIELLGGAVATVANLTATGFSILTRTAPGDWVVTRIPIDLAWGDYVRDLLVLPDGRPVVVWQVQTKTILAVGPPSFPSDDDDWEIETLEVERAVSFDVSKTGRLALFSFGGGTPWTTEFFYQERVGHTKWTPAELMFGIPTRDRQNHGAASGAVVQGVPSAAIRIGTFLRYAQRSDSGVWTTTMLDARIDAFSDAVLWASPTGHAIVWYSSQWWLPEVEVQLQWHTIDQNCRVDL